MRLATSILIALVLLVLTGLGLHGQGYLTKEGRLAKPLKVVQLQGGFAGFTGVQYIISPDGSWTQDSVFNKKITPKMKGKLTEKQLAKLGALLEKYALAKLPAKSGKPPGANPRILNIEFGGKKASLVGQLPPKLDRENPTGTIESRFAGIWQGITELLKPAGKGASQPRS